MGRLGLEVCTSGCHEPSYNSNAEHYLHLANSYDVYCLKHT